MRQKRYQLIRLPSWMRPLGHLTFDPDTFLLFILAIPREITAKMGCFSAEIGVPLTS
jgi:hypothetical protein